jgi:hypothetical protein
MWSGILFATALEQVEESKDLFSFFLPPVGVSAVTGGSSYSGRQFGFTAQRKSYAVSHSFLFLFPPLPHSINFSPPSFIVVVQSWKKCGRVISQLDCMGKQQLKGHEISTNFD